VVAYKIKSLTEGPPELVVTYVEQRAAAYPTISEQLDYIYHNGIEAWKENLIDPIKTRYPKTVQPNND